ncbi:hypothetical protein [Nocardiopsis sp. YSL2]|uniref:hypothetical protein n=1 Tax=Nocardiopsis sp. YSL2 TaxID=2939492 RepID=UPI0026F45B56|nr:hypothetical protein [Nocardiopsis sp. YSL2]
MGHESGADVTEAHSGGVSAENAALRIIGASADFEDAIEAAKDAGGKTPGVTGWAGYSSTQVENIRDVEEHARDIAGNIQSSAEEIASTDQESGGGFSESDGDLSRPINHGPYSVY